MDTQTKRIVRDRANNRCEYCRPPQKLASFVTFHIEHIQATQHVEDDSLENLALACPDCNRYKGPNLTTLDPVTRQLVLLFHPREDRWRDHFHYSGGLLVGDTTVGEATIRLLQINSDQRVGYRNELLDSDTGAFA